MLAEIDKKFLVFQFSLLVCVDVWFSPCLRGSLTSVKKFGVDSNYDGNIFIFANNEWVSEKETQIGWTDSAEVELQLHTLSNIERTLAGFKYLT